ncbi:MAG TPA: YggS family pyridoxal phosphate-dependent enzyme [Polyangiaceae bacterium LLY-WYZ-15_(1-7)]|nr:YggS family pyridoxal phosphate-dependent enzyme [Sandaracinus sp.]HJK91767.1 YggS family pyridoxal phosphate-dependent enzyme [Polyangiaceae bacterium LLY-WYZ-15_(1-7)]MBJ75072.1 YggS family pyridoxal phosphate-dependent enzyme [Sandaracinus sp.]HJL05242.1 YggS family pyridoxal phosphate-dependent enzyme [Polyangiaceae bacterium LLY-WYZ-15_(1-7)]HJL08269.1 YggS family pyridoxal phosphate-dependent enzyme [Polyangiaceae bacterium LLY-WYZ-15_(1-7)]
MSAGDVAANLAAVRARVDEACRRAGRDPAEVTLLAVSKVHGPEAIRAAYEAGQRVFGENYVQELVEKAEALADLPDLRFRFIGHLQRNKAKYLTRLGARLAAIDTVDSARLAKELAKRAAGEGLVLPVLLQVNVGREAQKSGVLPEAVEELVEAVRAHESLALRGLMTVPPADEDPRPHFRRLRELAEAHALPELSMGMSGDLEVAVEEGATMVRVGTAIFGPRPSPA